MYKKDSSWLLTFFIVTVMSIMTADLIKNCLYNLNRNVGREGGQGGRCQRMRVKPSSIITEYQYINELSRIHEH